MHVRQDLPNFTTIRSSSDEVFEFIGKSEVSSIDRRHSIRKSSARTKAILAKRKRTDEQNTEGRNDKKRDDNGNGLQRRTSPSSALLFLFFLSMEIVFQEDRTER